MNTVLIKRISETMGKPKIVALSRELVKKRIDLTELIDITFHADSVIGFRAAWIMENICLADPAGFSPYLPYFISRFNEVSNPGCKRHYAKIMMHLTDKKAPGVIKQCLDNIDLEPIVEQCFDWMIDPQVLVAVKVFAGETLFNLRGRYPWIAEELANQLEFLMRDGTAAIQSKGKRLLKALYSGK